jgi:hypothetical protein
MAIYKFSLEQAISTTSDSLELAMDDLGNRSADLKAKDAKERKAREAVTSPEEVQAKRAQEKQDADSQKKVPTLRRPGEAAPPKG